MLKGLFAAATAEPVSYVNAPQLAAERGLEVRETSTVTAHDFVNLITVRAAATRCRAPWPARGPSPGSSCVDDHTVEVPPSPHMLVVRNDDRPGMIGVVGTILGDAGVSISSMAVGPSATGNTALMVLSTTTGRPTTPWSASAPRRGSATSTPSAPEGTGRPVSGPPADRFAEGQVVTVFRSRRRAGSEEAYGRTAAAMEAAARAVPGFVDFATFTGDDGDRVSVVTFATPEAHAAWRDDPAHRAPGTGSRRVLRVVRGAGGLVRPHHVVGAPADLMGSSQVV